MLIDAELIDTWRAHGFAKLMGGDPDQAVAQIDAGRRSKWPARRSRPASWCAFFRKAASAARGSCNGSSRACWKFSAAPARRSFRCISTRFGAASSAFAAGSFSGNGPRLHPAARFDLVWQADSRSERYSPGAAGRAGPGRRRGRRAQAAHRRPAPRDDSQLPQGDVPLQGRRFDRHGADRRQAARRHAGDAAACCCGTCSRRMRSTSACCCRRRSAASSPTRRSR